jgi:hypothetical protein
MKADEILFDACLITMNELKTDARTLNIARTLVKNGYSICVIAAGSIDDINLFEKENIKFFPVKNYESMRAWRKILNFWSDTKVYFDKAKAKIFIAEDLYSLNPAVKLKRKFKGKLVYDSREIYSALGPLSKHPLKQKIITLFEKRNLKYIDRFIATGSIDKEFLKEYFKTGKPFSIVMNLPPYKVQVQSSKLRDKYSIPHDKKIIIYQGELLPGRGLIPIIKSLQYFENAVFCILGKGSFKQEIIKIAEKFKVNDRVILCGSVPYDELHEWTSSADIGVAFIEPISVSYQHAFPNKMFEYCMARIPSLVSDLPAMKQIIEKYSIGAAIQPKSSPEFIAENLKELCLLGETENFKSVCDKAAHELCFEAQESQVLSLMAD